jgi:hypothetical protein
VRARRALIGTREQLRPLLHMTHADGKETVAAVPWRAGEKETTLALVGGGSKAKTNSRGGKSATSSGGGATKRKTRASATTGKAIAKSIHAATRGWLATRATAQAPTARMMKTARDRSRRQRCPRAFALIGEVARVGDGGSVGGLGRLRRSWTIPQSWNGDGAIPVGSQEPCEIGASRNAAINLPIRSAHLFW